MACQPLMLTVDSTLFFPGLVKEKLAPGSSTMIRAAAARNSAAARMRLLCGMGLTK